MVGGIESVTVGVRDLEAAVAEFRDRLRAPVLRDTCASVGLLAAWQRPVHESVRLVELGRAGEPHGRVRLASFEAPVSEPAAEPLCVGPLAFGGVATLTVLAEDLEAGAKFYMQGFGWRNTEPGRDAARAFGPGPVRVRAFAAEASGAIDVLLGHHSDRSVPRSPRLSMPGRIGINFCTAWCEDLDAVRAGLAAIGVEPVMPPTHVGLPIGTPGRVMLVRGPSDELFELVDRNA